MLSNKNILNIFLFFTFGLCLHAQNQSLNVGNVLPGQLDMSAFNLSKQSNIEIQGVAASFDQWDGFLNYYAWIVKSDNRDVVWNSTMCEDYELEDGDFTIDKTLELVAGNYEVYFAAGHDFIKYEIVDFDDFVGKIFQNRKESVGEYRDEFYIGITGKRNIFKIIDPEELVDERNSKAIVAITRVGDYENIEKSFSLSHDTELYIYGVGEGINKQFYDFGYIYDVTKNKRVWMFNKHDAQKAGGGNKNIKVEKKLTLPKGSYYVKYVTDDSHSFDEWNVLPPEDPQYWGITIFPANDEESRNVIPFQKMDVIEPIVEISKVQENQFRSQGFSVEKDMDIRVLCVGEGIHEMVDYGWIVNADTRETIWKMKRRNTEYAGGSKKNRMVDEVIRLNKGNYIAYYVTDDSHSFLNWNDAPPFEAEDWGIKIWSLRKEDEAQVQLFHADSYVNENLIVEILRVGDDEIISEGFELDNNSDIRIIAIGEGRSNEMFDYGWIENNEGKVVWEMQYRKGRHAGGARKNKIFNDVISLPSGKYKVFFKTDDSHSFPEWNDSPPDEQEKYGITILLEK